MENITILDKDVLLLSITANSNGFMEYIHEEELVRFGKNYLHKDDFINQWLENGKRMMFNQKIERLR
jgi:hypothetical protein